MKCQECGEPAWYRCPRTGTFVCLQHARLEVVASHARPEANDIDVRSAVQQEYARLEELALYFWGETTVECFGREYDVLELPALTGLCGGEVAGILSHAVEGERMTLVLLHVLPEYQGRGLGSAMLARAVMEACAQGLFRVVVATTNDHLPALAVYQRSGFVIAEVLPGRLVEHHGGVEEKGFAGIPVRDEVRLELPLG
jgi:GNAT superfamily N-acetyltransferase